MKKVVFALSLCLVLSLSLSAQETLTITTYYPAPFGVYQEFRVHGRVSVGDANNDSDINNGDLAVYPAGHFTGLGGQPMPGSLSVQRAISIGGAAPRAALDVHARGDIDTAGLFSSNGYTSLGIMRGDYSHESSLVFKTSVHPSSQDWRVGVGRGANNKDLLFATGFSPDGPMSPVVITHSEGKMGIGTITPQSKLDVSGEVKIGNTGATCNNNNLGAIRYNEVLDKMEFCKNAGGAPNWSPFSEGSGGGEHWVRADGRTTQTATKAGGLKVLVTSFSVNSMNFNQTIQWTPVSIFTAIYKVIAVSFDGEHPEVNVTCRPVSGYTDRVQCFGSGTSYDAGHSVTLAVFGE